MCGIQLLSMVSTTAEAHWTETLKLNQKCDKNRVKLKAVLKHAGVFERRHLFIYTQYITTGPEITLYQ